jgi:hypothetical protein
MGPVSFALFSFLGRIVNRVADCFRILPGRLSGVGFRAEI